MLDSNFTTSAVWSGLASAALTPHSRCGGVWCDRTLSQLLPDLLLNSKQCLTFIWNTCAVAAAAAAALSPLILLLSPRCVWRASVSWEDLLVWPPSVNTLILGGEKQSKWCKTAALQFTSDWRVVSHEWGSGPAVKWCYLASVQVQVLCSCVCLLIQVTG